MIFRPVLFRPLFGRILTGGVAAIAVYAVIAFLVAGNIEGLLRSGGTIALIVAVVVALYWNPSIHVQEHEITVRNVFRTAHVPWPAIERVDTKFALTLYTPRGQIAVWASPAPSRYSVLSVTRGDARDVVESGRGPGGSIRPGDALNTDSGAVANIIRRHWEQLRDDGFLDDPRIDDDQFRSDTHWWTIATLAVLLAASILGATL